MLDRMLARDLWHLRGQAVAAALVVACGVASFIAMRSTYNSLRLAQQDYYAVYRFADVFAQVKRAPDTLAARIKEIPGVTGVRTRVVQAVTLNVPGLDEPATGRLASIPDRRRPMINDIFLRSGRYIRAGSDDEVLASEAFATANHLRPGDRIGAILNGRLKQLRIVGIALSPEYIYEVGAGQLFPDNRRFGVLWMGHKALSSAFDMERAFDDVVVTLGRGTNTREVIARMDRLLAAYGGTGAYDREEQVSNRFISDEIAQNRVSSTYVPAIFFGVTALLLHIVLSRLVALQRGEIGILKAFGYSNAAIVWHYIKLAAATVAGGILLGVIGGTWLGSGLTVLYRDYYRFPSLPYQSSTGIMATAVLVSLAAAVLGALSAVRTCVVLAPSEAMRPQPPASFRPGMMEALGLGRHLSSGARIILRNLSRRRWRAFLSVAGIACAAGILLVGGFFIDAVNYLLQVQFERVHREDVTVLFHEPLAAATVFEIARLPGVRRVEPFRSVPATLRFQHRSRRVELTGLPSPSDLHPLIDDRLRPVRPPKGGLILARKLAEKLDVKVGENLRVHVLEGKRPVREIRVDGLVDEMTGLGAYMNRHALAGLLEEDDAISGAWLAIDPAKSAALYRTLKRLPAVGGISIREAALASFRDILDKSIRVTTLVNIVFACVIAFGIVYNSARISLSERGNELASLRVLGFTNREVTFILLGEQAVLTLLAIPFGLLLGYWICVVLSERLSTELYRLPLVIERASFAFDIAVVLVAAALSGLLVARRIRTMDLIAVLKTRE